MSAGAAGSVCHRKQPKLSPLPCRETLCRRNFPSPFPGRHPPRRRFGGTGATSASGQEARGSWGGKGRHFRLGPRVSPERRHLLRLLSLLPAETPAPVSDGVRGPGTRVPRGRGASSWPAAIPRMHPPPNVSASLPGPRQGIPNH